MNKNMIFVIAIFMEKQEQVVVKLDQLNGNLKYLLKPNIHINSFLIEVVENFCWKVSFIC